MTVEGRRTRRVSATLVIVAALLAAIMLAPARAHVTSRLGHLVGHLNPRYFSTATGAGLSSDMSFAEGNFTTILSKSITVPAGGVLQIAASVGVEDDCDIAGANRLGVTIAINGDRFSDNEFDFTEGSQCGTSEFSDTISVSVARSVSAGTHTVTIQAAEQGTGSFITGRSLTVVFIPNGSAAFPTEV